MHTEHNFMQTLQALGIENQLSATRHQKKRQLIAIVAGAYVVSHAKLHQIKPPARLPLGTVYIMLYPNDIDIGSD